MNHNRVVLGFSGGIDSVAAVSLLQEQNYIVDALTLDLCGDSALVEKASCRAKELNVKFEVWDRQELFQKEIKDYFISEYINGRTPAPCTKCNPQIKWRSLIEYADKHSIYHVATGHYFKIESFNNNLYVARPADRRKDQSYYLWGLTQPILQRALTPMANMIKEEVKRQSDQKRESMGVCFLEGLRYSDYILKEHGSLPSGDIVDSNGDVVAQHNGIANYTIGQKRGAGIPSGSSIIGVDNSLNRLIVGNNDDLLHTHLIIDNFNYIDREEILDSSDITVMVRGLGLNPEGFAKVEEHSHALVIKLDNPAWACAAGQPVVLYREDRVVGGGYLLSSSK